MRCPKCGAFIGEGTDVCFMCGTNIKTYNPNMANGGFYGQQQGGNFPGLNDYDNIYNNVKNKDKDVFDFFADNSLLIKFISFISIVAVVVLSGVIYYKIKSKETKLEPVVGQLYYKVDDIFQNIGEGEYSSSGEKGSACNIVVAVDSNSSDNYVDNLFKMAKQKLEPQRDKKQIVIDKLKVYTSLESSITINGTKWYYMNVYYPETEGGSATVLKYQFYTTIYNGFAYNAELINNNNEDKCSSAFDNFVRSLTFLEKSVEIKK